MGTRKSRRTLSRDHQPRLLRGIGRDRTIQCIAWSIILPTARAQKYKYIPRIAIRHDESIEIKPSTLLCERTLPFSAYRCEPVLLKNIRGMSTPDPSFAVLAKATAEHSSSKVIKKPASRRMRGRSLGKAVRPKRRSGDEDAPRRPGTLFKIATSAPALPVLGCTWGRVCHAVPSGVLSERATLR